MPANEIKRKVKIVTEQRINNDKPPEQGLPIRSWNIEIFLVGPKGEDVSASAFEKVIFDLHPSFGKRAKQVQKKAPFRIAEEGWGEFEMLITLYPLGKSPEVSIGHDLNFAQERYEEIHEFAFKNPKPDFLRALEEAGLGVENGAKKAAESKKRGKKEKNVDMEKLADALQKLAEEDLLHVVQLIHDQKTSDTYTKNDVDNGEFHVDLYTLPDQLVKTLWDFTASKVEL